MTGRPMAISINGSSIPPVTKDKNLGHWSHSSAKPLANPASPTFQMYPETNPFSAAPTFITMTLAQCPSISYLNDHNRLQLVTPIQPRNDLG